MNLDPFINHMIAAYENSQEFSENVSSSFSVKLKTNDRYKIKINIELIDLQVKNE